MRSRILIIGVLAVTAGLIYTLASAQNRPVVVAANDAQAIQKASDLYTEAFNKADLDTLLTVWAPDAEYVDETGKTIKGHDALAGMLKKAFQESKGAKMRIKTSTVRFLKDDVAVQDGTAVLTRPNSEDENNPFTTLWMKKEGKWQLYLVRDLSGQPAVGAEVAEKPHARLKDLAWLVGDWTHEDNQTNTALSGHWMKGEQFLVLEYTIRQKDAELLSLTQIIGWDPTGDRLHSWVFDSRGGFGEGYWSGRDKTWTVEVAGVTADGRHGDGTHKFTQVDAKSFTFEALDRNLDGQPLPNVKITYQRGKKAN